MKNSFPSVILSVAKNLAMLSIAAVMFVACGGDNGSSAKDEEIDSSSSGVILSDSEESSSSVVKSSSSSAKESSSSSVAKYVCDIYTLADALSCKCDENREGKLSYNYDSNVELVCIHDAELNKWGWIVKKDESSSSSEARSSSSSVKESSSSVKVSSSSGAKSSSSVVKSSSSSVKASSSSGNSKFDFEWNEAIEVLENPCNESNDGKIGKAWYRDDQGEFQCIYNTKARDWEWSQIGGISSSSAKSSSSSVKVSSSSVYVPFDHSRVLASETYIDRSRYKQFTDSRNGRSYYYITIVGKDTNDVKATVTIMAENLNIGKDVAGVDDQNDDSVIERYCYKNDTTYCDEYGGLYQWAEMMQLPSRCNTESCADLIQENHQGICPDGWRLMNKNDFAIVIKSEDNVDGAKGLRSSYFQGSNASGFSLLPAGMRTKDSEVFRSINETAFWYYPQEHISEEKKSYIGYVFASGSYPSGSKDYRDYGLSVRCAKLETEE